MSRRVGWILILVAQTVAYGASAEAQDVRNVAVIINETSAASVAIGEYYVKQRSIPDANVIRIEASSEEEISRTGYLRSIEGPIAAALSRHRLQDRILYLVLTKGIPLRVTGTSGPNGTIGSVDSELTLLYRKLTGQPARTLGRVDNPYYLGSRDFRQARRFDRRTHDIYLVSRLDAFTVEEATALVDRAQSPATAGQIVLDQRAASAEVQADRWLETAGTRLTELGFGDRIVLEKSPAAARGVKPVLGYYSWGSNDQANRIRRVEMGFVAGSIAASFVSTDGRTFQPPPDDWVPSDHWTSSRSLFAGTPQSLAGDLIREGVTGLAANVAEPYLTSAVRPEILFPAYLSGFNLIESFYLAMPHLSWQTIVVGDPLCAPFQKLPLTSTEIEEPLDPTTELPAVFSRRRMEVLARLVKDVPPAALAAALLSESRTARGDEAGARKALETAGEAGPSFAAVQLQLALLHQTSGDVAEAVKRYRLVLDVQPDNRIALNNLAYALAVDMKAPEEARPFALRASALAPNDMNVLDTLAWVEYLLGNHSEAARLIAKVTAATPNHAEARVHAAFIYAALTRWPEVDAELKAALKLDQTLANREDVKELMSRIPR